MASGGYQSEASRKAALSAGALPGTAITQTYATTTATVPAVTYVVYAVTTVATSVAKTNSSPYGFSSGDADKVVTALGAIPTDLAGMQVEIAAIAADNLANRKLINQIVDDLQAFGIES